MPSGRVDLHDQPRPADVVSTCSTAAILLFTAWLAPERVWLPDIQHGYLSIAGHDFSLAPILQDLTTGERCVVLLLLAASLAP